MSLERIVLVTRRTRLDELIARFNTVAQARFYIEHTGGDFSDYQAEHDTYARAVEAIESSLGTSHRVQSIDRSLVPTFLFADSHLVVAVGQDGLVANVAKYIGRQPLIGVNPDPGRFDGVLLPFQPAQVRRAVDGVTAGKYLSRAVTMAEARLNDGQRLLGFNDLFVGVRSHVSARYRIEFGGKSEAQSSSGILVSTGAGSTGWLSSVVNMTRGVAKFLGQEAPAGSLNLGWEAERLVFVVREPFISRHSEAGITAGTVDREHPLEIESRIPSGGVIFSDGVEADFLRFESGAIATIGIAPDKANLVVTGG